MPFVATSTAAFNAPQSSWPSTTISTLSSTVAVYSTLPTTSGSLALSPATRTVKSCPRPWSNTISGGTRESAQAITTVDGS